MKTATDRADDLFLRLMLNDDRFGLPPHVSVVAADVEHVATMVWQGLGDGMPTVVVDAEGGEMLISRPSRVERIVDRICRRSRVRVETRRAGEPAFRPRGRVDRDLLERELARV